MSAPPTSAIPVAARVDGFTYAIRNIVAEAKKVEAAGRTVRYLNIGDPIPFGFHTPPHLVEAVARAMRDGHNGYTPSPGIASALPASQSSVIRESGKKHGVSQSGNATGVLVRASTRAMRRWCFSSVHEALKARRSDGITVCGRDGCPGPPCSIGTLSRSGSARRA